MRRKLAHHRDFSCIRVHASSIRLAIIGDVHDAWGPRDEAALKQGALSDVSCVVFVGDFGNENVRLVKTVSQLDMPKAVILGNHDAWFTMIPKRRKESLSQLLSSVELLISLPSPPSINERETATSSDLADNFAAVQAQLNLLGESHVGFSSRIVSQDGGGLSALGARPFAKGGPVNTLAPFYEKLYGIKTEEEFTSRIVEEGKKAAERRGDKTDAKHSLIILAHNGPAGLGEKPSSICGIDWRSPGGDHGDPELTQAISTLKQDEACCVPLVTFGHMHHTLRGGGLRQMVFVDDKDPASPTIYLNAATVPRVRPLPLPILAAAKVSKQATKRPRGYLKATQNKLSIKDPQGPPSQHHFLIVDMEQKGDGAFIVTRASDVWVNVSHVASSDAGETTFETRVAEEQLVLSRELDGSYTSWNAHLKAFKSSQKVKDLQI